LDGFDYLCDGGGVEFLEVGVVFERVELGEESSFESDLVVV
jgi:hypothetical protein